MILWQGKRRRSPVGIDIGGRRIKAVQLSQTRSGWRIEATASFARSAPDAPLSRGEALRIAEVLRRRSFEGNQIVLAVPEEKLIVGTMELPARIGGISLDAAARTEFARAYKCDMAAGFEMAYWDLPAPARAGRTTNVMAAACMHSEADALVELFAEAELDVVGLDARPCALARACAPAAEDAAGGIVILVELGWNGAVLVVLHRGVVVYERTIAEVALKQLLSDLAGALKVAPEVAEFLLSEPNLFPTAGESQPSTTAQQPSGGAIPDEVLGEVRGIVAAHFGVAAREVMASVSYSAHQYPDAAVSRLLLTGGGALLPGVAEHLQTLLGFECRIVTPMASATGGAAGAIARECNAALTTSAGLAQFNEW
jgi:type IV pilus assembly protein PilM